jgi:hypothetical protein
MLWELFAGSGVGSGVGAETSLKFGSVPYPKKKSFRIHNPGWGSGSIGKRYGSGYGSGSFSHKVLELTEIIRILFS